MSEAKFFSAYRVVFYRLVCNDTGHEYDVPIWSTVVLGAASQDNALDQGIDQFQKEWHCARWSDVAGHIEVEEIGTSEGGNLLPHARRVVCA